MKKLLLKIFVLTIPVWLIAFYGFYTIPDKRVSLLPSRNILILGDSHTQCALNDSIILGSQNYSNGANPYFTSFVELREAIKINTINTVILSYDYTSFLPGIENSFYFDDVVFAYQIGTFYPLYTPADIFEIIKYRPTIINSVIRFYLKDFSNKIKDSVLGDLKLKKIIKEPWNYGEYLNIDGHRFDVEARNLQTLKKAQMDHGKDVLENNCFQVIYLKKIYDLCRLNNIRLILFNSPVYPLYFEKRNIDMGKAKVFLDSLKNKVTPEATYLDFAEFPLTDDEFLDYEHLNNKGAIKVSRAVAEKLN